MFYRASPPVRSPRFPPAPFVHRDAIFFKCSRVNIESFSP